MKTLRSLFFSSLLTLIVINQITAQCIDCGNTTNTGTNSSAIGTQTISTGNSSFASGFGAQATNNYTTSLGFYSFATNAKSVAIGSAVKANSEKSVVIGAGDWNANIYLENNHPRSLMIGFKSKFPTLFVSESPMSPWYDKTGKVGIGNVTSPQAKLHIYSDEDEDATLFLEPSVWSAGYNATIWFGNQNQSISANTTEGMAYTTEINHVFKGGDVYIEDIDKGIIMKSPDGRCWRGTLNNEGLLNFSVLESCPEVITDVPEPVSGQSESSLKVYPNPTSDLLNVAVDNPSQKSLTISLMDEKGRELRQVQTTSSETQFYTGDLKPGIYFVKVSGTGEKLVSKVIRK